MKLIFPRNKLIPDPGLADIIAADPRFTDKNQKLESLPSIWYRGNDINLPSSAQMYEGNLFWCSTGLIYLPKYASDSDWYFAIAKEATMMGIKPWLSFGLEAMVGEVPHRLKEAVEEGFGEQIEERLFAKRAHHDQQNTIGKFAEDLIKKGAVYFSLVQIVEIEYQIFPRFLRQPATHLLLTYEQLDGERATYGYKMNGSKLIDDLILKIISKKVLDEFNYLTALIKSKQIDSKTITLPLFEKYKSRYGDEWTNHLPELEAEYMKVEEQELERQGFTERHLYAALLELIDPLIPAYRQLPRFNQMLQFFEYTIEGRGEEAGKMPLEKDLSAYQK